MSESQAMVTKDSQYRVGRFVVAVYVFLGWLQVIGGIVCFVYGISRLEIAASTLSQSMGGSNPMAAFGAMMSLASIGYGVVFVVMGLFGVMIAQLSRAAFDTADANRKMLAHMAGGV